MPDSVPVELFVMVAEALERAENELEQLRETAPPVPDGLQGALDQRLALLATLHRAAAANEALGKRLRATYADELTKGHHDPYELPNYAVDEQVLEGIRAVHDLVERRVLSDRDVDHALRGQIEKGWAW